jgi:hypothetical protein
VFLRTSGDRRKHLMCVCVYIQRLSLQLLVRRLGDEGRDILESDIGMDRLTVPRNEALFKREGKQFSCCWLYFVCYVS